VFAVWGSTAGIVMAEPRTFDKGLVFVKDTDIFLSGDKWTTVVNITLDDYDALVLIMKTNLNKVRQKVQVHKYSSVIFYFLHTHWDENDRLVQELDDDLQGFRKLLFVEALIWSPTKANSRTRKD